MTQKIEQSQRQERVAAWNRRAECDLAAFQNSPKQTYQAEKARDRKLCANLEEAIRRSGLQDGMTVSFHHAFRGGDLTVNMVMDVIAKMGFKNLTLASSSLSDCHAPLVEHIRQGVVTRIYTSGLRGPLAEEISPRSAGGTGADPLSRRSCASGTERRTEYRRGFPRRPVL
ncbi:citrate lyase subunit alpha [Escherichia coli]|uniref:Citrate lyase subunit alpha n=1 Tax=Escherichia coli TaxID=562 RepID=A0A2X3K3L9_ECOLX|nr:citrate lyase subunit alpha [Escherichia coli]